MDLIDKDHKHLVPARTENIRFDYLQRHDLPKNLKVPSVM